MKWNYIINCEFYSVLFSREVDNYTETEARGYYALHSNVIQTYP